MITVIVGQSEELMRKGLHTEPALCVLRGLEDAMIYIAQHWYLNPLGPYLNPFCWIPAFTVGSLAGSDTT